MEKSILPLPLPPLTLPLMESSQERNGRGKWQRNETKNKAQEPSVEKMSFHSPAWKQDRITQTGGTSPSVAENRAPHQACSRMWHHPSCSPAQSLFTHTQTNVLKTEMFRMQLFVSGRKVMCAACLVVMTQHHNSISPIIHLQGIHGLKHRASSVG